MSVRSQEGALLKMTAHSPGNSVGRGAHGAAAHEDPPPVATEGQKEETLSSTGHKPKLGLWY